MTTTIDTLDAASVRAREFAPLVAGGGVYLNSASTGPLPARTTAALHAFNALRAEPHRISQDMQFGALSDVRARCARLIGADVAEIALQINTSYGINLAARALPLQPDHVVVIPDREFPANVYPWMALERARGVRLEIVPTLRDVVDEDALIAALDRSNVRVLAVSWVSFSSGCRVDLGRLGRACRERGIWFVVDAIQGLGPATLDVHACEIDILACGAQKWLLSPWGCGFAYVRRELIQELEPPEAGWLSVRHADDFSRLVDYDLTWRDDARRFECGTLPFQDFAAMAASLGLLFELGPERVAAHAQALASQIVAWATDREDRVRLVTPAESARRAGIVTVRPPNAAQASERLTAAGIVHSLREGGIRLAPYVFNTDADVAQALDVLDAALG